jgi:hypothetical protein
MPVSTTIGSRARREAGVSVFAASLVAWLAGSTVGGTAEGVLSATPHSGSVDTGAPASSPVSGSTDRDGHTVRIALVVDGDDIATATLADTPAGRAFAATLPITLDMEDRFGQAKIGSLPEKLPHGGPSRVFEPAAGHIYYWPLDDTVAVVTADLGPSIPAPGLVALGAVDTGLDALHSAGNRFEMTIEPAD